MIDSHQRLWHHSSCNGLTGRLPCHHSLIERLDQNSTKQRVESNLLAARLALGVDNMKAKLSGCESLNRVAEPGRDLLEIDVFHVTKPVRAKNPCNTSRIETSGPTFIHFLKLFGPLRYQFPHFF